MIDTRNLKRLARRGTDILLARPPASDPRDLEAWGQAVTLWNTLFEPFSPVVDDADILEIGCGDGRLLGALANSTDARALVGLERSAQWKGQARGVPWVTGLPANLELHADLSRLVSLDEAAFDLVLCRDLEDVFSLDQLGDGLERIHGVLRPGGEAIIRVRCPALKQRGFTGPGYGVMTPTAWMHACLAAGFEFLDVRRIAREPRREALAVQRYPQASDAERMTREMRLHLVRPWESWELDRLRDFGPAPRRRKG